MRRISPSLVLVALALSGCDDSAVARVDCGVGEEITAGGQLYCAFEEDDLAGMSRFECPAGVPYRIDLEGAVVCSPLDIERDRLPDQVCAAVARTCRAVSDADVPDAAITDMRVADSTILDGTVDRDTSTSDLGPPPIDMSSPDLGGDEDTGPPPDPDTGPPPDEDAGPPPDPCHPEPGGLVTLPLSGPPYSRAAPDVAFRLVPRLGAAPIAVVGLRTGTPIEPDARAAGHILMSAPGVSGTPVSGPLDRLGLGDPAFGASEIVSIALEWATEAQVAIAVVHRVASIATADPVVATVGTVDVVARGFGSANVLTDATPPELRGRGVAVRRPDGRVDFAWRELLPGSPDAGFPGTTVTRLQGTTFSSAHSPLDAIAAPGFMEATTLSTGTILVSPSDTSEIAVWPTAGGGLESHAPMAPRTGRVGVLLDPTTDTTIIYYPSDATIRRFGLICNKTCFDDDDYRDSLVYTTEADVRAFSIVDGAMAWVEERGDSQLVLLRFLDDPPEVPPTTMLDLVGSVTILDIALSSALDGASRHYAVAVTSAGFDPTHATQLDVVDLVRNASCD